MSGAELQRFVLRSQVISLYRKFIRAAKTLPGNVRGEVLAEVRREFELQQGKQEPYDIKYTLSDGRSRLKMLRESIGFSR
eukprot:gene1484-1824_t